MQAGLAAAMLIGGALLSGSAHAQGNQQLIDTCYSPTASDDDTITSCTALIQTGQYSGVELSAYYNNRAYGYVDKRLYDLGIQDDNTAILLDPTNAQARDTLGSAYFGKSLYDQAIADFTHAIALKPDYANAYKDRGLTYEKLGRRDEAIADYRAALRIDPSEQAAKDGLARLGATP